MKPVLIIENSKNNLKVNESASNTENKYVLGGIFTEFDVRNRNERIYTAEEYVPFVNEMMKKKEWGVIYGEFDHPDVFDVSMKYVSHIVENAWHNKEKNTVDGEIRLLNTHYGKDAQALVDDGCPIFVSSRAAGVTEANGNVKLKQLFTYDIVADPGFSSAKMSVKTLNESLGFGEELSQTVGIFEANEHNISLLSEAHNKASSVQNSRIFDLTDETKTEELFKMNKNELVTKKQFSDYSKHLIEQLAKNEQKMHKMITESKGEDNVKSEETLTELIEYNENIRLQLDKMVQYMNYLAEKIQVSVDTTSILEKKTDDIVEYTNYLSEELDTNIEKQEQLSETVNQTIDYSEYLAEELDKSIQFSNYIVEQVDQVIDYSQYIAENLSNSIKFSNYIVENLERAIDYSEYIAENLDANIGYSEMIAETLDTNIGYTEYIVENLESSIEYSDYLSECIDKTMDFSNSIVESLNENKNEETTVNEKLQTAKEFLLTESNSVEGETENTEETTEGEASTSEEEETTIENVEGATSEEEETATEGTSEENTEENTTSEEEETTAEGSENESEEGEASTSEEEETANTEENTTEENTTEETTEETTSEEEETVNAQDTENFKQLINDETSKETIGSKIDNLIEEAKKREASKEVRPNFYEFITPSDIQAFENLSNEEQDEIKVAISESTGYYKRQDVLNIIKQVLESKKPSADELLIQSMPEDVKAVWENLGDDLKKSVLSQSKLYNVSSPELCEHFWQTRDLNKYVLNEGKTLIASDNPFDKMNKLSEEQVESITNRFKNL